MRRRNSSVLRELNGTELVETRSKLLNYEPAHVQHAVKAIGKALVVRTVASLKVMHVIGSAINNMLVNVGDTWTECDRSLGFVADYFQVAGGRRYLFDLKHFATRFRWEYVEGWLQKAVAANADITLSHWLELRRIENDDKVDKFLELTIENKLSANALSDEISGQEVAVTGQRAPGGGRKHWIPVNPVVAMQKSVKLGKGYLNFAEALQAKVFPGIAQLASGQLDEKFLQKLETARDAARAVEAGSNALAEQWNGALEEAKRRLALKIEVIKKNEQDAADDPRLRRQRHLNLPPMATVGP